VRPRPASAHPKNILSSSLIFAVNALEYVTSALIQDGPDLMPKADPNSAFVDDTAIRSSSHPPVRSTPCFTPGAMIATHRGELQVEELVAGDRVITRDNGVQTVRWVGKTQMYLQDFQMDPHLLPVLIRRGALGKDLPERDLMVSPNHRILVANERTSIRFADREVLVPAKHIAAAGVQTVQSSGTTYIHFMCDRHEVVLADGAWTESFHPDDQSLKGMGNAQRLEIFEIFPGLKTQEGRSAYGAARPFLSEVTEIGV
jgi:Hint domain